MLSFVSCQVGGFSVKGSHFDQDRWTKARLAVSVISGEESPAGSSYMNHFLQLWLQNPSLMTHHD
jgi:hypothetical protein